MDKAEFSGRVYGWLPVDEFSDPRTNPFLGYAKLVATGKTEEILKEVGAADGCEGTDLMPVYNPDECESFVVYDWEELLGYIERPAIEFFTSKIAGGRFIVFPNGEVECVRTTEVDALDWAIMSILGETKPDDLRSMTSMLDMTMSQAGEAIIRDEKDATLQTGTHVCDNCNTRFMGASSKKKKYPCPFCEKGHGQPT